MEKGERVAAKREDLLKILDNLPEIKKKIAADLIEQAAFLAVTLEDLNESINKNGTVEAYQNGANQSGRKVSSDAKLYSNLIAKYAAIITKLIQLIPDEKGKNARIETPENTAFSEVERAAQGAADVERYKKQKRADEAFLKVLAAGKVTQDDYHDFVKSEWAAEEDPTL